ncbi:TonB family protein [Paraneptunicella aestuarii]|uniref:energy transducer TonB n=1 Tax=Paraneptunicella aestuarii TaxID=2831148 RepID=UPI001E525999|nr:energy transducer TonB [Paraneptunicella aestuarii]UAA38037.1 TonB family protein [Paraneptunicella aestuarii]
MHQHAIDMSLPRIALKALAFSLAAITITFLLFVLMQQLITTNEQWAEPIKDTPIISPFFEEQDSAVVARPKIPALPEPKVQPKNIPPDISDDGNDEISEPTDFTIDVPRNTYDTTIDLTSGGGDARPVVQIEPKYPAKAAQNGIEGWVKLMFDINAQGLVENVRILDAEPKRVFEAEAKRALKRWKYKPKMENGRSVKQTDVLIQLEFNLGNN